MLGPLRILFFYLVAPPTLLAVLLFFVIEPTALSSKHRQLSQSDIQRAKQILNASNHGTHTIRTIDLNEDDLNIASNYLLNHLIESSTRVTLEQDSLHFVITLTLPDNLFGPYLNITFNLRKKYGFPAISSLKIGRIEVADEFAGQLIELIIKNTSLKQYYLLASQHINHIRIQPDRLSVTYITFFQYAANNPSLLENAGYRSLVFYQQLIDQIVLKHDPAWRFSLAEIMQPMFSAAYQRSNESNAAEENRAVIIAVSSYVHQKELSSYLPIQLTTKYYPVFLYKRTDLAKHFVASAAMAAVGATALAHMLGEDKELSDSRGGSGFSFIDLACDRAGMKFGQTAIATPSSARNLQKIMSEIEGYQDFMPEVIDLPERMPQEDFKRRYGSVYSPKYQSMLKLIDQRISSLPIYQLQ